MKTIQEPMGICKHDEALSWINNLMTDLKLTLRGEEPVRPITTSRLSEWLTHHRDLLYCQVPQTTGRWNIRTSPKHDAAADWLNRLVMDLVQSRMGYEARRVTWERLSEFREYRADIEACRISREVKY